MRQLPDFPDNRGKQRSLRGINGETRGFEILDEIRHVPPSNPEKVFYLQRLQFGDATEPELRLAYYMIGKAPGPTEGRWVWVRYSPLIYPSDLQAILDKAKAKGWL